MKLEKLAGPDGSRTSGLVVVVVATRARTETETEGTFAGETITARARIESHLLDPAGRTSDDCVLPVYSVDTRAACSLQPSHGFWTLDILNRSIGPKQLLRRTTSTQYCYITFIHSLYCMYC